MNRVVKILFLSTFVVFKSIIGFSQNDLRKHIIILDSIVDQYHIEKFTLNTKELYNLSENVEIFNIFLNSQTILLFSVLPSFEDDGNWQKIKLKDVRNRIFSRADMRSLIRNNNLNIKLEKNLDFAIVKRIGENFFISKNCLTEVFDIRSYPPPFTTTCGTINFAGNLVSIKDMEIAYKKQFPKYAFPMNPQNDHSIIFDEALLKREYLSKIFKINGGTAYQFWTFIGWNVMDGWNVQRGIDRFVFLPGKGIVGGSFDFWFAFKPPMANYKIGGVPVKAKKMWDNIINERVMLAEELK